MNTMETSHATSVKRRGRPLSFDRNEALDKAILQFWKTGYETTGVAALTKAMGITAPSLYTAFGDKESLFLECVQRYTNPGPRSTPDQIREAPSAKEAARQLLEISARWFTQPKTPAGCLVAGASASGSDEARVVRATLTKIRSENQEALRKRAERDIRQGRLPKTANARALAAMTTALVQGMSTLAQDGADQKQLLELVQAAIAAWPDDPSQETLVGTQAPRLTRIRRINR